MADVLLNKIVVDAPVTLNGIVIEAPVNIAKIEVAGVIDIGVVSVVAPVAISSIVINAPIVIGTTDSTGTVTYTGTAERNVGGISDGQVFDLATMTEMWDSLIKQEKFPVLSGPSSSLSSSVTGYREVGEIISSLNFTSSFNMGGISPQYTALSQYRSGPPNTYNYTGAGLVSEGSTALTNSQSLPGYTVTLGTQAWSGSVSYDAGVQPKSSYDNDYNSPLPAGTTSTKSVTIEGVYPYYGNTSSISVLTKQPLASLTSAYVQINLVAESGLDKQQVEFPQAWANITGIQFFNTVSKSWEWINGSASNSLTTFTKTASTENIQGNVIDYWVYEHVGALIGARQTRWYT